MTVIDGVVAKKFVGEAVVLYSLVPFNGPERDSKRTFQTSQAKLRVSTSSRMETNFAVSVKSNGSFVGTEQTIRTAIAAIEEYQNTW